MFPSWVLYVLIVLFLLFSICHSNVYINNRNHEASTQMNLQHSKNYPTYDIFVSYKTLCRTNERCANSCLVIDRKHFWVSGVPSGQKSILNLCQKMMSTISMMNDGILNHILRNIYIDYLLWRVVIYYGFCVKIDDSYCGERRTNNNLVLSF